ncbi:MFS sit siderophore-iron:H+ symporter [Colletotrichum truncatum]|uniref:MFS sit siderophore-iron:H+ symporter n=1 Tax=Colletotrichum truncatum TaxID=5467 RepID=A0ACC3YW40_COLTU|nr:MFS sit siderophore-iron:H+ symporter [Colletotrichum truncatum]XP_036582397.1 MFS sit siderophore-iron:H+ symporter [Colletotrichum truncatum]KAF6780736.1 MFS sit siderophore-iron:H+ symporter [Colletotrichum truncatum]KAF6791101.1 MFS sit siderophore-iron:H+ symporter [Colletotrichum truncatum]
MKRLWAKRTPSDRETSPLLESEHNAGGTISRPSETDTATQVHTSSGVARSDTVATHISQTERIWLFVGVFLVGYAYGLDSQVRGTYQPYATSSLKLHSSHSTINVLRSVVAVASQPTAAKIADIYGRFEMTIAAILLYIVGTALEASATTVEIFCVGAILYQIGYTCLVLLLEVLVADFSSMRSRVFFSYIPAIPFVFNTWISGNVTAAVLRVTTWRWGIGMWAIILPISSIPLLTSLYSLRQQSRRSRHARSSKKGAVNLFHQLDTIGLTILIAAFSFTLAPLTLAGGTVSHWKSPAIIIPLVLGLLCFPAFVIWERQAQIPLIPFRLLQDRGVWSALAVRSLLNFAWSTQGNYLYTVLIVAFDFSVETATRILSFFSFFGVFSGVLISFVIYRTRRLKGIIVTGACIFMASFFILIAYSGGASSSSKTGLIIGQIVMGLAGGLFAYPTQASIQASADHEHVAVITSLYLSLFNVGSALGNCLSGALWTQLLYPSLKENLAFQPNATLAEAIYNSPFSIIPNYPVGGRIREAIIDSYSGVQRLLCIAALLICVPMVAFTFILRNPKLSEERVQSSVDDESD